MTPDTFVATIEGYYGKYDMPLRRAMVLQYMVQYNQEEIDKIFDRVVRTYSGQYRFAPDIAVIEKAVQDYNEEMQVPVGGKKLMIGYRPTVAALPEPGVTENERTEVGKLFSDLKMKLKAGKKVVKS